jgi:hypothetical protein
MSIDKTKTCLLPHCKKHPFCRGLCRDHYQYAMLRARQGKIDLKELERLGKILPKKTSGMATSKYFADAAV